MKITHHGASNGVTGSCHQLWLDSQHSVLIDCGLFQGEERQRLGDDDKQIDFCLNGIEAVIVTHCHIDHIGRLPHLLIEGFRGPIYCSNASAELMPLILRDAIALGITSDSRLIQAMLGQLERQLRPVEYNQWHAIDSDAAAMIRLNPAGHILGSSVVEVALKNQQRVVFSGDLGCYHTPLLPDPVSPERADLLVMESTYGNRSHQQRSQRTERLKQLLSNTLADGGATLIPAFSIGRTQELLYEIEEILFHLSKNAVHQRLPIILDSPLASQINRRYQKLQWLWDNEAKQKVAQGRHPLNFEQLITIDSHQHHQALVNRLAKTGEPAIIIAASGMCSGGRIINYLKALAGDPRTDILFVGYQAKGTLGHRLSQMTGPGKAVIDDELMQVNAKVHSLSGYSAHADQPDLIKFVRKMTTLPKQIRLIHGTPLAQKGLAQALKKQFPGIHVELAACLGNRASVNGAI
ncbi:MBL fold metallo-hydrolase RNA specificity domain-containing protein [Ferrimonas aestuarii]|uniref:MBL fold metallo-hydrolase n=1 Tax=Ferrimonas aestuarii TaxID=2569539 RepID=A0A4U1BRK6_9GAMM|nr:MBL fold metallo-hydrolase [Ferrimonas aestuarii]TKB58297.1 MBL fold metallo-hydrolase [Ferrimonas aestuarii]